MHPLSRGLPGNAKTSPDKRIRPEADIVARIPPPPFQTREA